jgi:hypothetical protein
MPAKPCHCKKGHAFEEDEVPDSGKCPIDRSAITCLTEAHGCGKGHHFARRWLPRDGSLKCPIDGTKIKLIG